MPSSTSSTSTAPRPHITSAAEALLRDSGSPYTLPTLISALGEVINQLTQATRRATTAIR